MYCGVYVSGSVSGIRPICMSVCGLSEVEEQEVVGGGWVGGWVWGEGEWEVMCVWGGGG